MYHFVRRNKPHEDRTDLRLCQFGLWVFLDEGLDDVELAHDEGVLLGQRVRVDAGQAELFLLERLQDVVGHDALHLVQLRRQLRLVGKWEIVHTPQT